MASQTGINCVIVATVGEGGALPREGDIYIVSHDVSQILV